MSYNEYSSYSLDPLNRSRFYGIYQGTVLDNTDFENKKRLTVIVPQVTGSDSLTLVRPSAPSGVLNSIQIPEVGAYVWVMFESGDPNYPVWMSSTGGSSTGVTSVDGLTGAVTLSGTYLTQTNAASTYEPKITAGTTAQYWRGDKTWQTFPTIPTATSALTNDSGFITSSALSPYLTTATAASTYEPKITAGTTAQYFRGDKSLATFPTALSSFSNDTNFITSSALSPYLTSATAASTYASLAGATFTGAISGTSGAFTSLNATSIGATTAGTGVFTTLTATTLSSSSSGSISFPPDGGTLGVTSGFNYLTSTTTASPSTTLQPIFGSGAQALTIKANTLYFVEGSMIITKALTTANSQWRFGFTFSNAQQFIYTSVTSSSNSATSATFLTSTISSSAVINVSTSSTSATGHVVRYQGYFLSNATTGGTMTPGFAQSDITGASGNMTVGAGAWIKLTPISSAGAVVGNWA